MTHSAPKKNGYVGNMCAFCHYWEGNVSLHSRGTMVEFDEHEKGRCIKSGSTRFAGNGACPKFELSNEASRYAR